MALDKSHGELLKVNDDNKHLINIICHDIISFLARILLRTHKLGASLQQNEDFERLNQLLEELISLVRGTVVLRIDHTAHQMPVDVQDIVYKINLIFEDRLKEKSNKIHFDIENNSVVNVEKASFVHHVLGNLIDNCIKFSSKDDPKDFKVYSSGERICFEISNRASSVHRANLESYIAGRDVTRPGLGSSEERGLGIGYRIAYRYCREFGADFEVEIKEANSSKIHVINKIYVENIKI